MSTAAKHAQKDPGVLSSLAYNSRYLAGKYGGIAFLSGTILFDPDVRRWLSKSAMSIASKVQDDMAASEGISLAKKSDRRMSFPDTELETEEVFPGRKESLMEAGLLNIPFESESDKERYRHSIKKGGREIWVTQRATPSDGFVIPTDHTGDQTFTFDFWAPHDRGKHRLEKESCAACTIPTSAREYHMSFEVIDDREVEITSTDRIRPYCDPCAVRRGVAEWKSFEDDGVSSEGEDEEVEGGSVPSQMLLTEK